MLKTFFIVVAIIIGLIVLFMPSRHQGRTGKEALQMEDSTPREEKKESAERPVSVAAPKSRGKREPRCILDKSLMVNGVVRIAEVPGDCKVTVETLKEFHARVSRIPGDAEDYEDRMKEAMDMLNDVNMEDLAAVLTHLAAGDDARDRMMALDIVGLMWERREASEDHGNAEGQTEDEEDALGVSDGGEEPNEDTAGCEEETSGSVQAEAASGQGADMVSNILLGCLSDEDADVRSHALEVMSRLPEEYSSSLASLVLSGDYADVKKQMLELHGGSDDFKDMSLFFHALDDQDNEITEYAKANLNAVLGMDFSSSAQAFEWWENNQSEPDK